jgi:hypothetical protein
MKKKLLSVVLCVGTLISVNAQESTNGVTTITGTGVNTVTNPPSSIWSDIGNVLGDVGISTNPTNYAAGAFAGIKTSGSQYSIGAYVIENVNNYVGIMVGVDQLFGGGKIGSENVVAGGLTLKAPTHPLRFLTSSTNGFLYSFAAIPYVAALASTPIGGTGNAGGGLGALVRTGINIDIVNFSGWELGAGIDYGNRTGAGAYNGNWVDGTVNIRKGF